MNNAQLINQDSKKVEYYTPSWIVEAARLVMGSIDLDPASSEKANQTVKANYYYNCCGLDDCWFGNVWLNHPFSKQKNKLWINKLFQWYQLGYIKQSCCITYASTSEAWFQPLMKHPQCYFTKRVNFIDGETLQPRKGVTKGSVVTYLGCNVDRFAEIFSQYGNIMVPYEKAV